jgi:ABC-type multidrug transport system ATPase subunit
VNIVLEETGKKFNSDWIFRNLDYSFEEAHAYAILGRNGSGKSTLLHVISGSLIPTKGRVSYFLNGSEVNVNHVFRHISYAAPYMELIEEFRLSEMLRFHFNFKNLRSGFSIEKIIDLLGFQHDTNKPIRLFSSGMKQRVKLIMAFLSDTPVLLLDEPTTNLDQAGTDWYLNLINDFTKNRTLIICSNLQQVETGFCTGKIFIEDYKK